MTTPDLVALRRRYERLGTAELLRLSRSDEFLPEVQQLLDEELNRRWDRNVIESSENAVEAAAAAITEGASGDELAQVLVDGGTPPEVASNVVKAAASQAIEAKRQALRNKVTSGAVLFILGVGITVFTRGMVEMGGGGRYVVAWGAIIFGGLRMVQGLLDLRHQDREP